MSLVGKKILLVISGGIAAYKCPDLVRRLRERGAQVRCAMTEAAAQFVTPMALAALTEAPVTTDQFSLTDDFGMSHIRLSRESDLVLVAPATANLIAKMATGLADDIASTLLLASDKPILVVPAMNVFMWEHPATQANLATLRGRGLTQVGPSAGDLACGEKGEGRMADVMVIVKAVEDHFVARTLLAGRHAIVTSGPTVEPVDPVRFLTNRSSGKQGHAVAEALARLGAAVTLISGPVSIPDPAGVKMVKVETALQMQEAVNAALPAEIAVFAAAVADWRIVNPSASKTKKGAGTPTLTLTENPDILAGIAGLGTGRPRLVVGFAAETDNLLANAEAKLARKGCDLIVANDVSEGSGTFGGDANRVTLLARGEPPLAWPVMSKDEVAGKLALHLARRLGVEGQP